MKLITTQWIVPGDCARVKSLGLCEGQLNNTCDELNEYTMDNPEGLLEGQVSSNCDELNKYTMDNPTGLREGQVNNTCDELNEYTTDNPEGLHEVQYFKCPIYTHFSLQGFNGY